MKVRFVFDASPLIHLAKAGLSSMIEGLEGEKFTVPAVFNEVVQRGKKLGYADAAVIGALIDVGVIVVRAPSVRSVEMISKIHRDIHEGESEVIALAKEVEAVAVLDDSVARAVARLQGTRIEGTYGIILRALVRGLIHREEAEDALARLIASGWRCDIELYNSLLRLMRGAKQPS
ncbi:MAG: DUF3368 domain-containing protein [Nitrososphaerales archaeon]|nr:DUF3368 domain-containing protein [Nitrososphaerales archaeon]